MQITLLACPSSYFLSEVELSVSTSKYFISYTGSHAYWEKLKIKKKKLIKSPNLSISQLLQPWNEENNNYHWVYRLLEILNKVQQVKTLCQVYRGFINERYHQTNTEMKTKFNRMTVIQESPIITILFRYLVPLEQVVRVVESKAEMTGKMGSGSLKSSSNKYELSLNC